MDGHLLGLRCGHDLRTGLKLLSQPLDLTYDSGSVRVLVELGRGSSVMP